MLKSDLGFISAQMYEVVQNVSTIQFSIFPVKIVTLESNDPELYSLFDKFLNRKSNLFSSKVTPVRTNINGMILNDIH